MAPFLGAHGSVVKERGIRALATYHPGRQALWHKDPAVRLAREENIRETFAAAAAILEGAGGRATPNPLVRDVAGRPTGYAGGENEKRWEAAVRAAFADVRVTADVRVQVELDFRLDPTQRGRIEPDLDNLIKSTVDALEGVLGMRSGTGDRKEADDVRVDRIVASKRPAQSGEDPGARIVVSERRPD